MFFVKALPLSPVMNVSFYYFINFYYIENMSNHLSHVFNLFNLNIMFTTNHMPCKLNIDSFNPNQMAQMQK